MKESEYELINYIIESINTMGGVKDKRISPFKTKSTKDLSKPKHVNNV